MLKYVYLAAIAMVFAAMSTSGAIAGPQDRSVRPEGVTVLAANWDDRICCRRGSNDFWATRGNCNRWGGYKVKDRACRENWNDRWDNRWWGWGSDWDRRICCKRGSRDWWSTARECRNAFGYEAERRECRDDRRDGGDWNNGWDNRWRNWDGDWNDRVCCKKGDRDWWSTNRDCRERGGWRVDRDECRDDRDNRGGNWNDSWDNRWRNWDGDWNERICCAKGDRDWWSTNRECRERGGWRVRREDCRRD